MKNITILLLLLSAVSVKSFCQTQPADRIIGVWLSEEKDGKIEIYKQGSKFFGKLIWAQDMYEKDGHTLAKDAENPDPRLKGRTLVGLVILTGFVYQDDEWIDGEIYDPENGKTYSCKMRLKEGRLRIRGIWFGPIGRTEVWTRVK